MRLTRAGWGCLLMVCLAAITAASTGNNLLYLLYSGLSAALLIAAALGRANLKGIEAAASEAEQAFRGSEAPIRLRVRNARRLPAFGVSAVWGQRRSSVDRLAGGGSVEIDLRLSPPHRGLNALDGLWLESLFPFGLIRHRRRVPAGVVLAFPRLRELHSQAESRADAKPSGQPILRRGGGEELFGVREYDPSDDRRALNWKLTAKTGRPISNEYATERDTKVTVRLDSETGAGCEEKIEEAASACRFHIDAGAEVKLITPAGTIPYGRGLLQLERMLKELALLGDGARPRSAAGAPPPETFWPADSKGLRRLTLCGTVLVYGSLFLMEEVSLSLLGLIAPLLLLAWPVQERGWKVLPEPLWKLLSLLMLGYSLTIGWRTVGVVVANIHLILYLIINRALNPLKREELGQTLLIQFLGFFLVSGLTISLWYFPAFLIFGLFSTFWLSWACGPPLSTAARPSAGLALPAAIAVAILIFAATPRVEGLRRINPFLAAGMDKLSMEKSPVTGFGDGVSLGFYGTLKKSSVRVMRVKPPVVPEGRAPDLYVRGAAFDRFDGRRWQRTRQNFSYKAFGHRKRSNGGRAQAEYGGPAQRLIPPEPKGQARQSYEFSIYPVSLSLLFTVGRPWLIEEIGQTIYFDHTGTLSLPSDYTGGIRYRAYSNPRPEPTEPRLLESLYLHVPPDPDGLRAALARQWTAGLETSEGKARAIVARLQREYDYSAYLAKPQTLEEFLFASRKGNCEYFATAGVILLRELGIPARMTTGFLASHWNEYGRFYDVRQSEAHAWVEAYLPEQGWVPVDPTPPQSAFSESAEALGRRFERLFDAAQARWYRHVIGYDQYVQNSAFRRIGSAISTDAVFSGMQKALGLALLGALLFAATDGLVRLRRRLRSRPAPLFARLQERLERAGLAREAHWTEREYALWLGKRRPELALVGELAELHYAESYGHGLSPKQKQLAQELYDSLRVRV